MNPTTPPPFADGLAQESTPTFSQAVNQADDLLQLSAQALHQTSAQWRAKANHASDATLDYIQREPIKAVLMSAAAGAAVAMLVSLFSGKRNG